MGGGKLRELSRRGLERAKEFTLERQGKALVELYTRILEEEA